jgi:hypothetical protein
MTPPHKRITGSGIVEQKAAGAGQSSKSIAGAGAIRDQASGSGQVATRISGGYRLGANQSTAK